MEKMEHGICLLTIAPVRRDPSHKAEQVNQLFFGDLMDVLEASGTWLKIKTLHDNYEGWVDKKQITLLTPELFAGLLGKGFAVSTEYIYGSLNESNNSLQTIVIGSSLPGYKDRKFAVADRAFVFDGQVREADKKLTKQQITEIATAFLNTPYQWGGRSILGIDCSGLTQVAYKIGGHKLKRDVSMQATQGVSLGFLSEAEPGDLAFFDNEEGEVIHVGMLIGKNKIIHASGKVRIDHIDHEGIYNEELGCYTHKLRVLRRLIDK